MDHNNSSKIEVKADLTKTLEKAYDDALKQPLKSSSNVLSTVFDFFHNTVLYPMQKYNLYAENKLNNYACELQERAQSIPEENLVSPRVNILGPTVEGLKYNLDEDYIKEMFTNILISDMDSRKQSKVLPSYVEIVKQLNKNDAEMLKFFKETPDMFNWILDAIVLDNLVRLRLIELNFNEYRNNILIYEKAFEKIQQRDEFKNLGPNIKDLGFSKGLIKLTDFGQNFIDICL